MNRYTVIETRFGAVYLHEFFAGDTNRCLHDHPWHFLAIVLRGGYWEEMQEEVWECGYTPSFTGQTYWYERQTKQTKKHWRWPGSILWRPAKTAHRIDLEPGSKTKTWSLVITGPKVRDWQFHPLDGGRPSKTTQTDPTCPGAN